MPSSFEIRSLTLSFRAGRPPGGRLGICFLALQELQQLLELALERIDRLQAECRARHGLQVPGLLVFLHLLASAFDRVLLRVQQVLDQQDQLDLLPLIDTVPGPILRRVEELELALPVPQHVRLEISQLTHVTDREELLYRLGGAHSSCSGLSSRAINSVMARFGVCPSNRMRCTIAAIGISTPSRAASAQALF